MYNLNICSKLLKKINNNLTSGLKSINDYKIDQSTNNML